MTSLHDGQWHSLCFSVSSSLLQPLHIFSSDQPMSTLVFCHPFLPIDHPSNRPSKLGFLTTSFSHPVGSHRRLSFEHQSVPLWRLGAQVSHITAPAGRLTCRVCTSRKLLPPRFLHPHTLRAEEHNHGGKFLLKFFQFHENRERDRLLLACSCCHLPPQLQPFCGRDANGLNSPHSRRDQAHPQQLPHTSPQSTLEKKKKFLEDAITLACLFFQTPGFFFFLTLDPERLIINQGVFPNLSVFPTMGTCFQPWRFFQPGRFHSNDAVFSNFMESQSQWPALGPGRTQKWKKETQSIQMADAVRSEKERSRDELVDERGMLALSGGKVKNKMHGINRRHQRRGETDRENMQRFMGSVAA